MIVGPGRSGTVEVVMRTLSVGRTGEEKSGGSGVDEGGGVGEESGVDEGGGVGEEEGVCEGDGVGEGEGGGEGDGTTIAVMTGAPVVDKCSPMPLVFPTSILVDTAAVVVMNHTVTSGPLVCSSTPLSLLFRSSRT